MEVKRVCKVCNQERPITDFEERGRYFSRTCRECEYAARLARRAKKRAGKAPNTRSRQAAHPAGILSDGARVATIDFNRHVVSILQVIPLDAVDSPAALIEHMKGEGYRVLVLPPLELSPHEYPAGVAAAMKAREVK